MKRMLLSFLGLGIFVLSGCGQATPVTNNSPQSTNVSKAVVAGSYPLGVVWNHQYYDANKTGILKVGKQIGHVTKYENHMLTNRTEGSVSNTSEFPVGTKIYKVPGKDESQAIAVQDSNGKYLEIDAASN